MSINDRFEINKNKKTRIPIMTFAALAAILVLSSFAATQLTASTAYAQNGVTLTGTCELEPQAGFENGVLTVTFTASRTEPVPHYKEHFRDGNSLGVGYGGSGLETYPAEPGAEYTLNLYQDLDGDFFTAGIERDELVATGSVTCPEEETPVEQIVDLRETINNMEISDRLKNTLQAPLTNFEKILTDEDPSNDVDACEKLSGFIGSVNGKTGTRGGLTTEQAEELISQAEEIRGALGC